MRKGAIAGACPERERRRGLLKLVHRHRNIDSFLACATYCMNCNINVITCREVYTLILRPTDTNSSCYLNKRPRRAFYGMHYVEIIICSDAMVPANIPCWGRITRYFIMVALRVPNRPSVLPKKQIAFYPRLMPNDVRDVPYELRWPVYLPRRLSYDGRAI